MIFPEPLELILEAAALRRDVPPELRMSVDSEDVESCTTRFPLTALVVAAIGGGIDRVVGSEGRPIDVATPREVLAAVERAGVRGDGRMTSMISAIKIEIAIAEVEEAPDSTTPIGYLTPLAGLQNGRWAMDEEDFSAAVPLRNPGLCLLTFDYDISVFMVARNTADFPIRLKQTPSHLVAFRCTGQERRQPLLVDATTARILQLSDGTRTVAQVAGELGHDKTIDDHLEWIEELFRCQLIHLEHASANVVVD